MSPAGSAVLRDMLVADVSEVVGLTDVGPDPLGWKLIDGKCVVLIDSNKFFFKFDSLLEKFDQKYFY